MAEALGWALLGLYLGLTALRTVLAVRAWRPPQGGPEPAVVVLQPILSGDPQLGTQLAANLAGHPLARFRWLVDQNDAEGIRVAEALAGAAGAGRVEVLRFDPAPPEVNPKVFKLARALRPGEGLVAVLDDDTVLPPGSLARAAAALEDGDLVTGVPYYVAEGNLWTRLVAAFVNGNSLLTYLPLARLAPPVTINGMFYLTTAAALERAGGFAAIEHLVCDDYELALRYRESGQRLVQAAIPHPLRTTVPDARGYLRILRRWLVFTGRLLRTELNLPILVLVLLPGLLPLLALTLAAFAGSGRLAAAVVAGLLAKALGAAVLRRRLLGTAETAAGTALEVVSDLAVPLHALATVVRPGRIVWRGRPMVLDRSGRVRP